MDNISIKSYNDELDFIDLIDKISKNNICLNKNKQFHQEVSFLLEQKHLGNFIRNNNELFSKKETLKKKFHYYLNKILFEIDSVKLIIDLTGDDTTLKRPQLKLINVFKQYQGKTSIKDVRMVIQLCRDLFLLMSDVFFQNSLKFEEEYQYSRRITLEIIRLQTKWKIILNLLKTAKKYSTTNFYLFDESSIYKKILRIDPEGNFTFFRFSIKNNYVRKNIFTGWKSVTTELKVEQRRLLFYKLFLFFSENKLGKFHRLTNWNEIIVKGYMLTHQIMILFKGVIRWSYFNIISTPIPQRHTKKIESFILQIIVQVSDGSKILKQIIKRICGIQTFFLIYYILRQFVSQRKKYINLTTKVSHAGQKCVLKRKGGNRFSFRVYTSLNSNRFYIYRRSETKLTYKESSNLQQLIQILYNFD